MSTLWVVPSLSLLMACRYLGADWRADSGNEGSWDRIVTIPAAALVAAISWKLLATLNSVLGFYAVRH